MRRRSGFFVKRWTRLHNHSRPAPAGKETTMLSQDASDLIELQRLAQGGAGALTDHLLKEYAARLIAAGCRDEMAGG